MAPDVTSDPQLADASGERPGNAVDAKRVSWQHVVAVIAAAAGGAAWVSAVGSAVVGLRLENANLPIESVVALMSTEHRFAIGAGYLIAPLFVGLVGFVVDWLVIKHSPNGNNSNGSKSPDGNQSPDGDDSPHAPRRSERPHTDSDNQQAWHLRSWLAWRLGSWLAWRLGSWLEPFGAKRARWALVATVGGSVVGGLLLEPAEPLVFILQSAALFVIVVVAIGVFDHLPPEHHRFDERVVVFVSVIVSAGVIALGYEQLFADPTFDAADIRLTEGATVEGGYITTTDTAVLLITRASHDCPAITAVRRDRIEQARIGPTKLEVRGDDPEFCTRTQDWRDFPADEP
jgi:hypothetical protein